MFCVDPSGHRPDARAARLAAAGWYVTSVPPEPVLRPSAAGVAAPDPETRFLQVDRIPDVRPSTSPLRSPTLGVNRYPLDPVDVDQIKEGELNVEFVEQEMAAAPARPGECGCSGCIAWGGVAPYLVNPMTLTFWGDGGFSLETLVDFAQRMRA